MAPGAGRVQDARGGGRQQPAGKDGWVSNTKNGKSQGRGKAAVAKVDEPKPADFVPDLKPILEPYGYDESAILALVQRCNCNSELIQESVSNILDEKLGHEPSEWTSQATASDRKAQAAAAKERRILKEKEIEEELEKEKERRARAWDNREAEARKRAAAEESIKKQARLGAVEGQGAGAAAPKTWGKADEKEKAASTMAAPTAPPAAQAAPEVPPPTKAAPPAEEKSSEPADWNQWSQRYGGNQAVTAAAAYVEEAPAPAPEAAASPVIHNIGAVVTNTFDPSEDSDFLIFPDYVKTLLEAEMTEPAVRFGTLNISEPAAPRAATLATTVNGASWIEQEDAPEGDGWEVNAEAWQGKKAAADQSDQKSTPNGDRDNGGNGKSKGGKGKKGGGKSKGRDDSWKAKDEAKGEKGEKGSRGKGGSVPNGDNRQSRKGGKGKNGKGEQGSGQKPRENK